MAAADELMWAFVALLFLATVTVILRIVAKWKHDLPIRMDDHMAIAAWVFLLVSFALVIPSTLLGYGRHLADLKHDPRTGIRLLAVSVCITVGAGALGKTSIAIRLLEMLDSRQVLPTWVSVRQLRVTVWAFAAAVNVVIWGFAIFLLDMIWNQRLPEICKENSGVWNVAMFGAAWSVAADFAFVVLLWPFMLQMKGTRGGMVGLGWAMGLGIIAGIIGIIKIFQMDCSKFQDDITHDSVPLVIWTFAEPVAIVIAASAPVLHLLCKTIPPSGHRRDVAP